MCGKRDERKERQECGRRSSRTSETGGGGGVAAKRSFLLGVMTLLLALSAATVALLTPMAYAASAPKTLYATWPSSEDGVTHKLNSTNKSNTGYWAFCVEANRRVPTTGLTATSFTPSGLSETQRLYLDCAVWWADGGGRGYYWDISNSVGKYTEDGYDSTTDGWFRNVIWAFCPTGWESAEPTGTAHLSYYNDGSAMSTSYSKKCKNAYNWIKAQVDYAIGQGITSWENDDPRWKWFPWYHAGTYYKFSGRQSLITAKRGWVKLNKTSSDEALTSGDDRYSLEGAQYGVYWDPSCSEDTLFCTLTTNASGYAESIWLPMWHFYVKEISPSPGFKLDETVYDADVPYQTAVTVNAKEEPQTFGDLSVTKATAGTGAETSRDFSFHVTVSNEDGSDYLSESFT